MNNQSSRNKMLVILVITIFVILGAVNIFFNNKKSYQLVSINITDNTPDVKLNIYKIDKNNKILVKTVPAVSSDFKLKKGTYDIITIGDGYQKITYNLKLGAKPEAIAVNPSFTKDKLSELLKEERPAIISTINNAFPQTKSTYDIEGGALFILGQWYGTTIHIKQTTEQEREGYIDRYKIILKKESDNWKVITSPPEIILSKIKYPKIPREILVEVNKNPDAN